METRSPALKKYQLYAHYIKLGNGTEGFLSSDRQRILGAPENDFYINIQLNRTHTVNDYIDVQKPDEVFTVTRQEFNPFYIEHSFFDSTNRIKVSKGRDLSENMVNFIISRRPDVFDISSTNQEVVDWYNNIGRNELPWNEGTEFETSNNDIDESDLTTESIISKATFFPIDINR